MNKSEKFRRIRESINILDYARSIGFTPIKKGKYYSLKEHDSVMIDVEKNVYWQNSVPGSGSSIGEKGSVIDFAMRFNNMTCYEVIKDFERIIPGNYKVKKTKVQKKSIQKVFSLPEKDTNMRKIFAYLVKTRCIAASVVQDMVERKMLYQDVNGNCVFVGYDIKDKEKPVFACKRGSNTHNPFYGDVPACDYKQCFHVDNKSVKVFVTESVIDAMSIMTLIGKSWKEFNYIALAGFGKWEAIKTYLENTDIKELYLSLDNDEKGIIAAKLIFSYVSSERADIKIKWNLPNKKKGKDWNEVLQRMAMTAEKK